MKCKICWLEYHNPSNWGETEEEGIKNITESLPTKSWSYDGSDSWIEVECEDFFEANDIKIAKQTVKDDYYEVDIFSVFNADTGERLFTEEDFETEG